MTDVLHFFGSFYTYGELDKAGSRHQHPDETGRSDRYGGNGCRNRRTHSLAWLNRVGVAAMQAWRQPMIDAVQKELRRRGYEPLAPEGTRSALVAFALQDARARLNDRLNAAKVRITLSRNRFRVSVGVFNDLNDIDKLLDIPPKKPEAVGG